MNNKPKKELLKEIENLAWGVIDHFNQEWVAGFTEDDWAEYFECDKVPNLKCIVDGILSDYEKYKDTQFGANFNTENGKQAISILKKYPKCNKDEIDNAILCAARRYIFFP